MSELGFNIDRDEVIRLEFANDNLVQIPVDRLSVIQQGRLTIIGDHTIRIISQEDLILVKEKAGRPQDQIDLERLRNE